VPETTLRSKRAVALAVAATLVGVSATVLLSGQSTTAHAAAAPGSTVRASVANGSNAQAPDGGAESELSADGTAVVFTSTSQLDNLDTGETRNVYVRDLRNNRTVMISRGQFTRPTPPPPSSSSTPPPPTTTTTTTECCVIGLAGDRLLALNGMRAQPPLEFGERPPTGSSSQPTISGDGRYVAFMTSADNILPEDDDTDQDLLVCDRDPDGDGVFDEQRPNNGGLDYTYFRVNQPEVLHGDGYSYRVDFPNNPKISDDASRIVWEDTLDAGDGYYKDVVRTAVLRSPGGAVGKPGTVEVVNSTLGDLVPDDQYSPDVSADGQFVVLVGNYVAAVDNGDGFDYIPFHAVVRTDMVNGKVLRVDWDVNTTPDDITFLSTDESVNLSVPSISSDGAEIAFEAEEFQDNCSEGCWHSVADQPMVFVVRIAPDERPVDSIVASRDNGGEIINGIRPALSGDGRFIAFGTDNLNAHDGVDRQVGSEFSSCVNFQPSEGLRGDPKINLSGLPPTSDTRNQRTFCQVVVRDLVVDRQRLQNEDTRLPGTLASPGTGTDCAETVPEGGTCAGNGDSPAFNGSAPSLSHNGSTIAYDSDASNLVPDEVDDNKRTDVYVRTFRPDLRPDPTPLDFGDVQLGDTFDQVVRFDHIGLGPLVVTDAVIEDSDEFAVGAQTCVGEAVVLQQTDNCEVSVTFAPTTEGDRAGTLRLTLRDGREFTVPLLGNGTVEVVPPDGPRFAAAPDPLNFGDRLLLSEGPTQTVTVTNVGDTPLTVKSISVVSAVAAADYTFAADTCTNVPVAANGTCQVTVRFSPVAALDRPAVLRFVDDAPGNQAHLIGLSGKGSTPTIQLSPGVAQPGRVVTVTGAGFAPKVPVTITLADSVETAVAVPNETGVFSVNMLILPKTPIGGRLVTATIDTTNPAIAAKASLLIVTPTVSPSTFVIRG
jgi:hypothetical protein